MPSNVVIRRYADIDGCEQHLPAINAIFFQSSNTRTFADDDARACFRERWLGRYLNCDADWFYIARDAQTGETIGYLAGCIEDPARAERFADIPYLKAFADLTPSFPAHLHVNVAAVRRGAGIGARLIEAFCGDAATAGVPGVHVITSAGARNVGFYERNGFTSKATTSNATPSETTTGTGGRAVVFLARPLNAGA